MSLRRERHDIIFLTNGVVASKIFQDHGQEFESDAIGIRVISITTQAFQGEEVDGGPPIRIIPLGLAFITAHSDSARLFEAGKIRGKSLCLFFRPKSGPEGIKGGRIFVGRLFVSHEVVVNKLAALRVPQVVLDLSPALPSFLSPLCRILRLTEKAA